MESSYLNTPFANFKEVVSAHNKRIIRFKYQRSMAYDVASRKNRAVLVLFFLGVILATATLVVFSVNENNYWVLFAIPVLALLNTAITHMKWLVWLCGIMGVVFYLVDMPLWAVILPVSVVVLYIGYLIWWSITVGVAERTILENEDVFEAVWKHHGIMIQTNDGRTYLYDISK